MSRIVIRPGQWLLVAFLRDLFRPYMLFILFISDISNVTVNGVFTKLYADNLKLYTSLISTDDSHNLQDPLSNLLVWSNDWQLKVNVSKCHILHLHKTTHALIRLLF